MRPDEAAKRVLAWHAGKPLPAYATRHFAIADDKDLLIVAFLRMGGESAPWGIVWGHVGKKANVLVVPEARNRDMVAGMVSTCAPALLAHFQSPHVHDWGDVSSRPDDLSFRQLWLPNASHVDMLHFLAYSYTFTKFGDKERYSMLNALGRLAGWLFREQARPGQMTTMAATEALRASYIFPAEDVRQAHLGYLLAWLETTGLREKRLAAAQEAEQHSISTSLDPSIERDELEPLVEQWNDQRLGSRIRGKAKADIEAILTRELMTRFSLAERAILHLREKGPRENAGVANLVKASLDEYWFQFLRMELKQHDVEDGHAFTASPETDRHPAAAASRYFVQQASDEFRLSALIHDDKELQKEALAAGDGLRGVCKEVRDEGTGRAIKAVWRLEVPEIAPLRLREGSAVCQVGAPKRTLKVISITRLRTDVLAVELQVSGALRAYTDEGGRTHPIANSTAYVGKKMTLVPVSMDQISRLKNKKIWVSEGPGAWITHAQPTGTKAKLPKEAAGGDDNLFEAVGKL